MNKKDVLGARPDAGNVQKNGKYAPVGAVPELLKIRHSTGNGTAGRFGCIWYLIPCQNKS